MNESVRLRPISALKLRQHVNLYTDRFAPKNVPFSARFILLYALLLVLAIVSFAALLKRNENDARTALTRAQSELALAQRNLETVRGRMGLDRQLSLEGQITQTENEAQKRRAILGLLKTPLLESQISPAQTLAALADAHQAGVWLTRIRTNGNDRRILLEGGTLMAKSLPAYIQALNAQAPFRQARFRMFSAQESAADKAAANLGMHYLFFRLGSGATPAPAPGKFTLGDREQQPS